MAAVSGTTAEAAAEVSASRTADRLKAWSGGAAGALSGLAPTVTLGLLAYVALGDQAAAIGIPASFIATCIGGSVYALLARSRMPVAGAASVTALMLGALVAGVVADPNFSIDRPGDIASLLALTAASVVAMGILQVVFAVGGLTSAARFVPQPVLAGFMNGVAIVFVAAQIPALLGWSGNAWATEGWRAFAEIQPATLVVGAVTIAAIRVWPAFLARPAMPRVMAALPGSLVGLMLGCATYALIAWLLPAARLGSLLGDIPSALPAIDRLLPFVDGGTRGLVDDHLPAMLVTAASMALIGTLDLVLNGLALDQALDTRTEPRRELFALGIANVCSGLLGGLPMNLLRARALVADRAGRHRRIAFLIGNAALAALALFGGPLLGALPRVVLAGIMVTSGLLLIDSWSLRLAHRWLRGQRSGHTRLDIALVTIVCAISVVWGFAVGVVTGAVLAVALFVRSMNRSLLRARRTAASQPSRRIYASAHEAVLGTRRHQIAILELEGALFFGSADRMTRELDALEGTFLAVVMDLRRITLIDASGAMVLSQIHRRLSERGVTLILAGLSIDDRHGRALAEFAGGALSTDDWYPDTDRAVEAAELHLLSALLSARDATAMADAVALSDSSLLAGLDAAACATIAPHLVLQSLDAGERLFAQGDAGDRLYVLAAGSISVVGGPSDGVGGTRSRFVTCSPGMMLGEIAMLDGGGRSGEAVADVDSEVYVLTAAALARLAAAHPDLSAGIYRNIALHLALRLRVASNAQHASNG